MALGPTEMKILKHLQADARVTNQELAEKIGMSASPCWRKVRKLEEEGSSRATVPCSTEKNRPGRDGLYPGSD